MHIIENDQRVKKIKEPLPGVLENNGPNGYKIVLKISPLGHLFKFWAFFQPQALSSDIPARKGLFIKYFTSGQVTLSWWEKSLLRQTKKNMIWALITSLLIQDCLCNITVTQLTLIIYQLIDHQCVLHWLLAQVGMYVCMAHE